MVQTVQRVMETPQLLFDKVVDVLVSASPCIRQSLSCSAEECKNSGFSARRLRMLPYSSHCLVRSGCMYCVSYGSGLTLFSTVSCIWQSLFRCVARGVHDVNLLGDDFWNCFRVRCSWFDSGYMFLPVYELIWKKITRFYVPGGPRIGFHRGPDDLRMAFLPHFATFFALRTHGRECPFFSPRW